MVARQRTGTETWSGRRSRQPSASAYASASWFETTGTRGAQRQVGELGGRPAVASGISGVWNAPPTLSGVTRRTPSSWARADPAVEPVGRPRDHDLSRRVVVGDPAPVRRRSARVVGLLGGGAQECGHAPGMGVGGGLGELGAAGGEADAVVEGEHARGDQRRDLAERMSGERDRRRLRQRRARPTRRARSAARRAVLRGCGPALRRGASVTSWPSGSPSAASASLDDRPAGWSRQGAAMPGLLGSLSGEDDRDAHVLLTPAVRGDAARRRFRPSSRVGGYIRRTRAVVRWHRSVDHYSRVTSVTRG